MSASKISFGEIAKTLNYEGECGAYVFCWELHTDGGKRKMYLERVPLTKDFKVIDKNSANNPLVLRAADEVREYLVARGYEVELI